MHNHAAEGYICPICLGFEGKESDNTLIVQDDVVYQDELVTALINSFFIDKNSGHVIVVPNEHYENIYDLPDEVGARIFAIAKKLAVAMREMYECEGITILQNNEPAGGQHAFHYHLHIFPRYENDALHANMLNKRLTTPEERRPYAQNIKSYLESNIS